MVFETDASIITYLMNNLIPMLVYNYIPSELYGKTYHDLFEIVFDVILPSGIIKDGTVQHIIVEYAIKYARNEDHYQLMVKWL